MVDEVVAERGVHDALAEREADRIGEALAERAGGGLDARGVTVFGMTGGLGAKLAEMLDLVDVDVFVAGQVEQGIKQHRAVAGRQDEAVAVGPVRIFRIVFQEAREQHGGDVGAAHRQAGMAGFRLFDGVHGKEADRVGHPVVFFARGHGSSVDEIESVRALKKVARHIAATAFLSTNSGLARSFRPSAGASKSQ